MACVRSGKLLRMRGWLAVSVFVARAPMETPPFACLMSFIFRRVRSTSSLGRSTSSFIRSRRFVPPARNFASGFAATAPAAAFGSLARTYLNGLIGVLLSHAGQLLLVDEAPRPRRLPAGMDLLDRRDDPRVGSAAADVAAHPFADLVVREPGRRHGHVFGDVAHVAAARLFEEPDGGADLPRRAVAALEAVVLDEGRLHRVELIPLRQPLDRRDLPALEGGGERQARQDAPPVDEHRAGPALPLVAALLRAGEREPFAQRVEQHDA